MQKTVKIMDKEHIRNVLIIEQSLNVGNFFKIIIIIDLNQL